MKNIPFREKKIKKYIRDKSIYIIEFFYFRGRNRKLVWRWSKYYNIMSIKLKNKKVKENRYITLSEI